MNLFYVRYNNKVLRSDWDHPKRHHVDAFGNRREGGVKKRFNSVSEKKEIKTAQTFMGLFND